MFYPNSNKRLNHGGLEDCCTISEEGKPYFKDKTQSFIAKDKIFSDSASPIFKDAQ